MFWKIHFTPLAFFLLNTIVKTSQQNTPPQTTNHFASQYNSNKIAPRLLSCHYLPWSAVYIELRLSYTSILQNILYTCGFRLSLCRLACSGSALFTPFNPFGESHANRSHHIWDTADTSCCARAEESMFRNVCSLLKGASANVVALHTAWLLGSFSKAIPGCKPCSLVYYRSFKICPEFSKVKRFPRKDANI